MKKPLLNFAILAILFSACSLEDGIDCTNETQRCDPNDETHTILQKCVNHKWVTDATCEYQCKDTEEASSCIEKICEEEAHQCDVDYKTLLVCQNNQWIEEEICSYSCHGTSCDEFECTENKTKCANDNKTLQICRMNRWVIEKECDYQCSNDACVDKVCEENQMQCSENEKDLLICRGNQWVVDKTCDDVCENDQCSAMPLPVMTFDPEAIHILPNTTQSVTLNYTFKDDPINNRELSISVTASNCFNLKNNLNLISTDSMGNSSFNIIAQNVTEACRGEINIYDKVVDTTYSIPVHVYLDKNNNFMPDEYETAVTTGNDCRKDSDCDSSEGAEDGFCDSFIGYKCSTRCKNNSECILYNEEFHFICRDDGRCAPDTFEIVTAEETLEAEIPTIVAADCDFDIDWGDNSLEHYDDAICGKENIKHQYANSGAYHIKIKGSYNNWQMAQLNDTASEFADTYTPTVFSDVVSFGPIGLGPAGLANNQFTTLSAIDIPDASKLSNLSAMFMKDSQFNSNIENWDVSNVEDMTSLFYGASEFNQPLAKWDTSRVTSFYRTFQECSAFNQPIETWDMSNATTISKMFVSCSTFNQPINSWNISNVTNLSYLFYKATVFDQPLDKWDTSNITNMKYLFYEATKFNQNINTWNTSKVTSLEATFFGASAFNQPLDKWNTSNVKSMKQTFKNAVEFNQNLNLWDTSNVTTLEETFAGASKFNKSLGNWNTSNVTTLASTFKNAKVFDHSLSWDTAKVTTLEETFAGADKFNHTLENWNTSNVTSMKQTFKNATTFNQNLNSWDTSNVTTLEETFAGASSFNKSLDNWNTSNVTSMKNAFNGAKKFDQNLSTWSLVSIQSDENMENMLASTQMFNYFKEHISFSPIFSTFLSDSNICRLYNVPNWKRYINIIAPFNITDSEFRNLCKK